MQPTPLTGTATPIFSTHPLLLVIQMQPTPLTGTATELRTPLFKGKYEMQPTPLTGTATAHEPGQPLHHQRCSPHPSRGRQRQSMLTIKNPKLSDAAHTPHGDGNPMNGENTLTTLTRCSPHPSRGRQRSSTKSNFTSFIRCSPHPSRGWYRAKKRGCLKTSTLFLYRTKVSRSHRTLSTPRVWIRF